MVLNDTLSYLLGVIALWNVSFSTLAPCAPGGDCPLLSGLDMVVGVVSTSRDEFRLELLIL